MALEALYPELDGLITAVGEPELVVRLQEMTLCVPFRVAASPHWMEVTLAGLGARRDCVEHAETGAGYGYMNLVNAELDEGLTVDEIGGICQTFGGTQSIF